MNKRLLWLSALVVPALLIGYQFFPGKGGMLALPAKKALFSCPNDNGVCKLTIYVAKAADGTCDVAPEYLEVQVQKSTSPTLRWKIEEYPHNDPQLIYRFHFDPANPLLQPGVDIAGNNSATDFKDPNHDDDGHGGKDVRTFKWQTVNKRNGQTKFDFVLNVQRSPAPPAKEDWHDCHPVDPRIINEGQ